MPSSTPGKAPKRPVGWRAVPSAKIILIGGAELKGFGLSLHQFDLSAFLQKPFDVLGLERALHDAPKLWRPYLLNEQRRGGAA